MGVLVTSVLAGCSGSAVPVEPPTPDDATAQVCTQLHHALPDQVEGQRSRPTTPESELTAAWADPPIVLRCGGPRPTGLTPTSELVTVNDVDWFPEQTTDGYTFTTVGRVANVQVVVPHHYAPEVNPLTDVADAVREHNPLASDQ
jgi:hypothetical protein